jgi:hypothetical protein
MKYLKFEVIYHNPNAIILKGEMEVVVDITIKENFWSSPKIRQAYRTSNSIYFRWKDNGKFTPGNDVEGWFGAWKAYQTVDKLKE